MEGGWPGFGAERQALRKRSCRTLVWDQLMFGNASKGSSSCPCPYPCSCLCSCSCTLPCWAHARPILASCHPTICTAPGPSGPFVHHSIWSPGRVDCSRQNSFCPCPRRSLFAILPCSLQFVDCARAGVLGLTALRQFGRLITAHRCETNRYQLF